MTKCEKFPQAACQATKLDVLLFKPTRLEEHFVSGENVCNLLLLKYVHARVPVCAPCPHPIHTTTHTPFVNRIPLIFSSSTPTPFTHTHTHSTLLLHQKMPSQGCSRVLFIWQPRQWATKWFPCAMKKMALSPAFFLPATRASLQVQLVWLPPHLSH